MSRASLMAEESNLSPTSTSMKATLWPASFVDEAEGSKLTVKCISESSRMTNLMASAQICGQAAPATTKAFTIRIINTHMESIPSTMVRIMRVNIRKISTKAKVSLHMLMETNTEVPSKITYSMVLASII